MRKQLKLYLDDEREAPDGWILVRDPYLFLELAPFADELSLDHDLGAQTMSGYDVICQIEKQVFHGTWKGPYPLKVKSHSQNPVGRRAIEQCIARIDQLVESQRSQ